MIDPIIFEKLKTMRRLVITKDTAAVLEAAIQEIGYSHYLQDALAVYKYRSMSERVLMKRRWVLRPFGNEWAVLDEYNKPPEGTDEMDPWTFPTPFEAVLKTDYWLHIHKENGNIVNLSSAPDEGKAAVQEPVQPER